MVSAIRQRVTVEPGGVVRVTSPNLRPGAEADVIVLVESTGGQMSWAEFIGAAKSGFGSTADVDAHIRELRDEWDN